MAILTALLILIAPVRIILQYDKSMNNEKVIRQGIGGADISLMPLWKRNKKGFSGISRNAQLL